MSNIQYMYIGEFVLGIPTTKMYDVATLKVDIRPAVENLRHQSIKWSLEKEPLITPDKVVPEKFNCRKGCIGKFFVSRRRRLTHERKYHSVQLVKQDSSSPKPQSKSNKGEV